MNTIEAAHGKWVSILSNLGIDDRYLINKHGPCPICKAGNDRYRFDNKNGNGEYICNQCGSGNGINLLMGVYNWEFKHAADQVDKAIGNARIDDKPKIEKKDPRIRLNKIKQGLMPIQSVNPVGMYLRNRGLQHNIALRYHPGIAYYESGLFKGKYPAMIAMFSSSEGKPISYHITYLTQAGTKADLPSPKKMMPPVQCLDGGAIRLSPPGKELGIAEGIETALACKKIFGIDTWAAYSANLLEKFEPPKECKRLYIYGDSDESFTGQKSAYLLAFRLNKERPEIDISVILPDVIGMDWADYAKKMDVKSA